MQSVCWVHHMVEEVPHIHLHTGVLVLLTGFWLDCRCSYWLDIQTVLPPETQNQKPLIREHAGKDNKHTDSARRLPLVPPQQTPGTPASPPPAVEFGLSPSGAITVISVPQLPADPIAFQIQDSAVQTLTADSSATHDSAIERPPPQRSPTHGSATQSSSMQGRAAQDSAAQGLAPQASAAPQDSNALRLELDLKSCDTQQLLLQAAACNAGFQLGKYKDSNNPSVP